MIRWYDYIAVFVIADLIWGNIKISLVAPTVLGNLFGLAGIWAAWYIWNEVYIPFRQKQELNTDE